MERRESLLRYNLQSQDTIVIQYLILTGYYCHTKSHTHGILMSYNISYSQDTIVIQYLILTGYYCHTISHTGFEFNFGKHFLRHVINFFFFLYFATV